LKRTYLYDFDEGDCDVEAGILKKQYKNPKSIV